MSTIDATLTERGLRYGVYTEHARITQGLKRVMNATAGWSRLSDHQKETLEMLAHKIGRILNGDPQYHDSWHDIVGYAKLTADAVLAETVVSDSFTLISDHEHQLAANGWTYEEIIDRRKNPR